MFAFFEHNLPLQKLRTNYGTRRKMKQKYMQQYNTKDKKACREFLRAPSRLGHEWEARSHWCTTRCADKAGNPVHGGCGDFEEGEKNERLRVRLELESFIHAERNGEELWIAANHPSLKSNNIYKNEKLMNWTSHRKKHYLSSQQTVSNPNGGSDIRIGAFWKNNKTLHLKWHMDTAPSYKNRKFGPKAHPGKKPDHHRRCRCRQKIRRYSALSTWITQTLWCVKWSHMNPAIIG